MFVTHVCSGLVIVTPQLLRVHQKNPEHPERSQELDKVDPIVSLINRFVDELLASATQVGIYIDSLRMIFRCNGEDVGMPYLCLVLTTMILLGRRIFQLAGAPASREWSTALGQL